MGLDWRDAHGQQQSSGLLWHLNDAQLVFRDLMCAKKILPTPSEQPEVLAQSRMDPYIHVVYFTFWPNHLHVAETQIHQTKQRFSIFWFLLLHFKGFKLHSKILSVLYLPQLTAIARAQIQRGGRVPLNFWKTLSCPHNKLFLNKLCK